MIEAKNSETDWNSLFMDSQALKTKKKNLLGFSKSTYLHKRISIQFNHTFKSALAWLGESILLAFEKMLTA